MDARKYFQTKYLSPDDLPDDATIEKKIPVVPEKIWSANIGRPGQEEEKILLKFKGIQKAYIVSKTAYKSIRKSCGHDTDNWMVPMLLWKEHKNYFGGMEVLMVEVEQ